MTKAQWRHAGEWVRHGRGLRLQFFALSSDVNRWLADGLPSDYGPYVLFESKQKRINGGYANLAVKRQSLQLPEVTDSPKTRSFWLVSTELSPGIIDGCDDVDFAINGLVVLQHPLVLKGGRQISSFACTSEIVRVSDGSVCAHADYARVFRSLVRRARHDLTYATLAGQGAEAIEDRSARMTEAAATAARMGEVRFLHSVGQRLLVDKNTRPEPDSPRKRP